MGLYFYGVSRELVSSNMFKLFILVWLRDSNFRKNMFALGNDLSAILFYLPYFKLAAHNQYGHRLEMGSVSPVAMIRSIFEISLI